jgi:hypothetical protein
MGYLIFGFDQHVTGLQPRRARIATPGGPKSLDAEFSPILTMHLYVLQ